MLGSQTLEARLTAAGIPYVSVRAGLTALSVVYSPAATQAQITQGDALAAAIPAGNRVPRTIPAVRADLVALTGAQQAAIWNDLTANGNAKLFADVGPNAGALLALWRLANLASLVLVAGDLLNVKIDAVTLYALDNPSHLVSPAFSPAVNVPGDQPAP